MQNSCPETGWAELSFQGLPCPLASCVAFSSRPPERKRWCSQPGPYPATEDCILEPPCRRENKKPKISPSAPTPRLGFAGRGRLGQLCARLRRGRSSERLWLLQPGKVEEGPGGTMVCGSPGLSQPFPGHRRRAGDGDGVSSAHAHPRPCRAWHQTTPLEEAPSCLVKDVLDQTALLPQQKDLKEIQRSPQGPVQVFCGAGTGLVIYGFLLSFYIHITGAPQTSAKDRVQPCPRLSAGDALPSRVKYPRKMIFGGRNYCVPLTCSTDLLTSMAPKQRSRP